MRAAIITGATKEQDEILRATHVGKHALSMHFGWKLYTATDKNYGGKEHPSWQKIDLIREILPNYDAVLWLDADSFVTNPKACPLPEETAFTISGDWCEPTPKNDEKRWISCGNFWTRNTPQAFDFFKEMESYKRFFAYRSCCCWEQDAFHRVMWSKRGRDVTILPRTAMNSVKCHKEDIDERMNYENGDFLCHLTNVPDRMAYIDELTADLIRNL